MKVVIERDDFLGILKNLILAVDVTNKSGKPILTQIHVRGLQDRVLFSANNLEIGIVLTAKAQTELPGNCTFSAKRMLELIKNYKKGKNVVLTVLDGERLQVSQGRSRCLLNTMDPEQFPSIPYFKSDEYMPLEPKALAEALSSVFYCVSKDETRPALTGILLEPGEQEGMMRVVATDGHRISCIKVPGILTESFILSMESCKTLMKLLKETEELGIKIGNGYINLCLDDGVVNCRLIARDYPAYRKIFPDGKAALISLTRKDTIDLCKRGMIFSGETSRLNFKAIDNKLVMTTKDSQSEAEENLPMLDTSAVSETLDFALNGTFLLQALEHLKEDDVTLRIYGGRLPIVVSEKNLTKALMPML